MTEHVHEWELWGEEMGFYTCVDTRCPVVLDPKMVLARLNATERLSATDAKQAVIVMEDFLVPDAPLLKKMKSYADIREGK